MDTDAPADIIIPEEFRDAFTNDDDEVLYYTYTVDTDVFVMFVPQHLIDMWSSYTGLHAFADWKTAIKDIDSTYLCSKGKYKIRVDLIPETHLLPLRDAIIATKLLDIEATGVIGTRWNIANGINKRGVFMRGLALIPIHVRTDAVENTDTDAVENTDTATIHSVMGVYNKIEGTELNAQNQDAFVEQLRTIRDD